MSTRTPLSALLGRACGDGAGQDEAFAELIRLVMIFVRSSMGSRLRDQRESMDVCQSIARSFVDDMRAGRVGFDSEARLAAYLQQVVRSKLADLARADSAAKRGGGGAPAALGPADSGGPALPAPAAPDPGASFALRGDEAMERALGALTPEERQLVSLRARGLEWTEIGAALQRDPGTLRQQHSRLTRRIQQLLGGGDEA